MEKAATPTEKLADVLLGDQGPVEDFVRSRRAAGRSWRLIARDLYDATDHQIDVTHETVRSWVRDEEAS